jgi:hypothetical protein
MDFLHSILHVQFNMKEKELFSARLPGGGGGAHREKLAGRWPAAPVRSGNRRSRTSPVVAARGGGPGGRRQQLHMPALRRPPPACAHHAGSQLRMSPNFTAASSRSSPPVSGRRVKEVLFSWLARPLPWDRWPWLACPQIRGQPWRPDGADPRAAPSSVGDAQAPKRSQEN